MNHSTHNIIPAALAEYCEQVRKIRMPVVSGDARVFESVIVQSVKPNKPAVTLKEIISQAVTKTYRECGNNASKAAEILGIQRQTVPKWLAMFLLIATTASAQISLVQSFAALGAAQPPAFTSGKLLVTWSTPTNVAQISKYRIAWGTNESALNNSTEVGKLATNITLKGLSELANYTVTLVSVFTNGTESLPAVAAAMTQPRWASGSFVTFFKTQVLAGRTNIVQSSTNGGTAWQNILTNTAGGIVTILRTNSLGGGELFRIKP